MHYVVAFSRTCRSVMTYRGDVVLVGGKTVFRGSPINDLSCFTSILLPKSFSSGTHVLPHLDITNSILSSQVKMLVPPLIGLFNSVLPP